MVKRKLRTQTQAESENESPKSTQQLKRQGKSSPEIISFKNVPLSVNEEHDLTSIESDNESIIGASDTETGGSQIDSFASLMKSFSFDTDIGDEHQKWNDPSPSTSKGRGNPFNNIKGKKSHKEVSLVSASSSHGSMLGEELDSNIRILPVRSKLCKVVLLQHPASLTLHGYVKVSVQLGSVSIFGYRLKEKESINVFSTEGTGLKKVDTLNSMHKGTIESFANKLTKMMTYEQVDIEEFLDNIGPRTAVLIVEKILLPAPLQFLELYYPHVLQPKWRSERMKLEKKEKRLDLLCSAEKSCGIEISEHFKKISEEVNKAIGESENAESAPHIVVYGQKDLGKSTLIRYLMNSALNKYPVVYFLDTDPGQTEYTPAGVLSLVRVTKPLLGPPFAHQKKPLKMFFLGSVTAATSPELYQTGVKHLMKYFNDNSPNGTLFVNTMGWLHGMGAICLQKVKDFVKPTMLIELTSSELSFTQDVLENDVTLFKVPSEAPPRTAACYQSVEWRNFNLVAYLGQCQKSYMPVTPINAFHPYGVCWDKIALYVMGKKVPPNRLVEAIHCSIVGLCRVDLSYILKSDNPEFPMTLSDEPVCECLGYGLVRASDETNHIFYIVTPLTLDELKNVNALIKGNIMIPSEMFLKQNILNVPLPFTDDLDTAKSPARKAVRKRAFRNTRTPTQTT